MNDCPDGDGLNDPPWTTRIGMLNELYGVSETFTVAAEPFSITAGPGRGLSLYDPKFIEPLIEDGLAYWLPALPADVPLTFPRFAALTGCGKEAVEMLRGERQYSKYAFPDWLLIELSKAETKEANASRSE